MADVQPLRAIHYDTAVAGDLGNLVAPPYDVIDDDRRAELASRSPHNVVAVDLPVGEDPYAEAARIWLSWRADGVVVEDASEALWPLVQEYRGPDGRELRRRGFLCRVRIEEYGAGRIRPHERTHPGPKEDRLRLTRATRTNLSPIFALYSDPAGTAWNALEAASNAPVDAVTDDEGTVHTIWRVDDPATIATVREALSQAELLIADGHHRYETARAYAEEIGGEGPHRFVLVCLVALEDPGLLVFPTHRLVRGLRPDQHETLAAALRRDFEIVEVPREDIAPPDGSGPLEMGYIDSHFKRAFRLTLRDQAIADRALPGRSEASRRLDTAILEELVLKETLGLTDEDISHLHGLSYARDVPEVLRLIDSGDADAAFVLRPTPVELVREVAAAGENMPPKSTFFHPKLLTGLLFNPVG
ncbi:MAG: hypothetical protein QOI98_2658 [Solirubrobacteraceae bacterium]|jgi:uncharacterized protein (DUF1015 family)|nr:hypothetical protein [Solirubrobacteraceae bacterium]